MTKRRVRLKEMWRPVLGYEGFYEVSSEGRVRRVNSALLNPFSNNAGRLYVGLSINGKVKKKQVSILVCESFCGGIRPSSNHVAAHWNGNHLDNSSGNLRWATYKENEDDKIRHGRYNHAPQGSKHRDAKLTEKDIPVIRKLHAKGVSTIALGKRFGVNNKTIWLAVTKRTWKHV